jgi:ATP-binding cassette subfamily F protein 3
LTLSHQPGKIILQTDKIEKSFGTKKVFENVDIEVVRGDKIAFVGQNGQGKSTLAKILVGELDYRGEFTLGHNVQIGYFAQNQSAYLEADKTVLEEATDAATAENRTKVRDLLGSFLFPGEAVDKKVHVLSGGERNRLALCKLLLQPFNVLIMDEPTNHLDIQSKNVLKEALLRFQGTLILVSHDRDFTQGLCQKVVAFRDGGVQLFLGDINAYLEHLKLDSLKELERQKKNTKADKKESNNEYLQHKIDRQETQKIEKIERKISQLEKEIKEIDFELEINYEETISQPDFFDHYNAKKKKLEVLMQEWEALQREL